MSGSNYALTTTALGSMSGLFVAPGTVDTMAALRKGFRATAIRHGLADLDSAAIRDGRPRALTQAISQWINTILDPTGHLVAGIQFDSRHGDGLTLWAVYERPGDPAVSSHVIPLGYDSVDAEDPDLAEPMRLLDLLWVDY